MALKAKSNETNDSLDDEDSKIKSYITRQFKKFMKNANVKGFDKDRKQSSSSQFKSQDRGKKDTKDGGQYTVASGPKCLGQPRVDQRSNKVKILTKQYFSWFFTKPKLLEDFGKFNQV